MPCYSLILYVGSTPLPSVQFFPSPLINLSINTFNVSMKCLPNDTRFQYSYTWEKQDEELPLTSQGVNSSQLTIINLRTEDEGLYHCTISNFTGKISSDYNMLTVKGNLYDMYVFMYDFKCFSN